MSNIEPNEEQKQAAREWIRGAHSGPLPAPFYEDLAHLLAEREAKLTASIMKMWVAERTQLNERSDTLRARVAELEAKIADAVFSCPGCGRHDFGFFASQIKAACGPCRTRAEAAEAREAQHLADREALRQFLGDREEEEGIWIPRSEFNAMPRLAQPAHYDDAKADAPAVVVDDVEFIPLPPAVFPPVCPKCQERTHPFYDVEQARWLCDRCHHPAGEPFVHDTEGGEG